MIENTEAKAGLHPELVGNDARRVIEIARDPEGYTGTFYDRRGASQEFLADAIGEGAAAVLDMDGRTVVMRMMPHRDGAQVTLVPIDATGKLLTGSATILGFLREGTRLPRVPEGFSKAPPDTCTRVAAYSFMVSYSLWEPAGVMNADLVCTRAYPAESVRGGILMTRAAWQAKTVFFDDGINPERYELSFPKEFGYVKSIQHYQPESREHAKFPFSKKY